jgi:LysM repeat protein
MSYSGDGRTQSGNYKRDQAISFQEGESAMSKKMIWLVLAVSILGVVLSACQRPASGGPTNVTTATAEVPFPVGTQPGLVKDILSSTQTAAAMAPTLAVTKAPTQAGSTVQTPVAAISTSVATTVKTATPTDIFVPSATPGRPDTYTIQKDEFPFCIARRFNVNPSDLLSLNNLTSSSKISVGATLKIPTSGSWPSSFGDRSLISHPTNYTVKSGDTINKVACAFGDVDPSSIAIANALKSPYTLTAGQTIKIP